jgi:hypothetical protein
MATFMALPVEIRNQVYEYVLHSVPLQAPLIFTRIEPEHEDDRPRFHYASRLPPEEPHLSLNLTNRQIHLEVNAMIDHLAKSNQMDYRFDLRQLNPNDNIRQDFTWIQLPALKSFINTITVDMEVSFRDYRQLQNLFILLLEMVQLFTRTLKLRQGPIYMPLTVNNLFINIRIPTISSLIDEDTDGQRAGWKLERIKKIYSDPYRHMSYIDHISARKCRKLAPRFKKVVIMKEDEVWLEQENLMLPEQRRKDSKEPTGYSDWVSWCWLGESRNGCKGKERLFD